MAEWDPKRFTMIVGTSVIAEYAPDTFIKAMFNEDLYSLEVGADGGGCRIRNANESGRFEITLLKSSMSNGLLSAQALLDRASGTGVTPVLVKDNNNAGLTVAGARAAWIIKIPDLERGKALGEITWIFETLKLKMTHAGIEQVDVGG